MKNYSFQPTSLYLLLILLFTGITACEAQNNSSGSVGDPGIIIPPPGDITATQKVEFLYYAYGNGYRTAAGGLGTIVIRDNLKVVKSCMGYIAYQDADPRNGAPRICFELYNDANLNGSPTETYCVPLSTHMQVLVQTEDSGQITLSVPNTDRND